VRPRRAAAPSLPSSGVLAAPTLPAVDSRHALARLGLPTCPPRPSRTCPIRERGRNKNDRLRRTREIGLDAPGVGASDRPLATHRTPGATPENRSGLRPLGPIRRLLRRVVPSARFSGVIEDVAGRLSRRLDEHEKIRSDPRKKSWRARATVIESAPRRVAPTATSMALATLERELKKRLDSHRRAARNAAPVRRTPASDLHAPPRAVCAAHAERAEKARIALDTIYGRGQHPAPNRALARFGTELTLGH
jgi:hypothetical protein